MIEMAGSGGLILLAGFTNGSFAANNSQGMMQAAVVVLQMTESVLEPASMSDSDSSYTRRIAISWVFTSVVVAVLITLASHM